MGALRRGQALLELAVFGSLMLMVLGAVVNYGLNADANQRAMMLSFREALSGAANVQVQNSPVSVSSTVVHDQHLPDPSNPFAIGSMIPASASAGGIARSNKLGRVYPDNANELPRTQFDLSGMSGGQIVRCDPSGNGCTTASLRTENVGTGSIARYKEVFGASSVCDEAWCGGGASVCIQADPANAAQCLVPGKQIRIVDSCDGEILNYDGCVRQARLMADPAFCARECNRGGGENCAGVCAAGMNLPWYAQGGAYSAAAGRWVFPGLEQLFDAMPGKNLGLQAGAVKTVDMDNSVQRIEVGQDEEDEQDDQGQPGRRVPSQQPAITARTSVDWTEHSTRNMVYHTTGTSRATVPVRSSMNRQKTTAWRTEWGN